MDSSSWVLLVVTGFKGKVFAAISIILLCLAGLTTLENISLLAAALHRSKFAMSLPYLLSWTFLLVACIIAGIGLFLHNLEDPITGKSCRIFTTRKVFIVIAVLTVFLTIVLVFENTFFLATALNQNPVLLFLPYPISWILIAAACVFGCIAFVLHGTNSRKGAVRLVSPSIWSGDSRPITPNSVFHSTQSLHHEPLSVSYNSQVFLPQGTNFAPQSPFSIEETVSRNMGHPPSYAEAVRNSYSN